MNNMELTRSVEILNQNFTDLNNRFSNAIPEMTNHINQSATEIKAMYEAIKSDIQPVIDQFPNIKAGVEKAHTEASYEYQKLQTLGKIRTKELKIVGPTSWQKRLL